MLNKEEIELNDIKVPIPLNPEVLEKEYRELYIRHKILLGEKLTLIEKLEEDIKNSERGMDTSIILIKEYYKNKKEYAQEILSILKGEKNE